MQLSKNGQIVMDWFREITKIPRCSGEEAGISEFLIKFAKDNNLEAFIEETTGNVIIKKMLLKAMKIQRLSFYKAI